MSLSEQQEQQLIRESNRGAKAKSWIDSEMTKEIFSVIEADTLEKWKNSPIRDEEGQKVLRLKWQVIQEMRKHVLDIAYTGKLAEQTVEQERTLVEKAKSVASGIFRRVV
jgi:hypothetical protein